jgi:hypothetical protein
VDILEFEIFCQVETGWENFPSPRKVETKGEGGE